MSKYAIWNKTDDLFTLGPPFKYTPEEWLAKYPWAESIPCVINAEGAINGAFCMPLPDMVINYTKEGCDFSACETAEDKLAAIEAFEDAREAEAAAAAQEAAATEATNAEITATSLASIAASMEYQNLLTLEDTEEV